MSLENSTTPAEKAAPAEVPQSGTKVGEFAIFRAMLRALGEHAGKRLWLAVGLLIASGVMEMGGLIMLLQLLGSVGISSGAGVRGPLGMVTTALRERHISANLAALMGIFVGIKVCQSGVRAWSNRLNLRIETGFTCFLRERYYRSLVQADWLYLSRQRASDINYTLMGELQRVGTGTQQLLTLLSTGVIAAAQVIFAIALSPILAILALACGGVVAWGLRVLQRKTRALAEETRKKHIEMASAVSEHLSGLKIAKSHGRETQHLRRFSRAMYAIADDTLVTQKINAAAGVWMQAGSVAGMGLYVVIAVLVVHIAPARMITLAYIFTRLLSLQTSLQSMWNRIVQSLPSYVAAEKMRAELIAAAEPPEPAEPARMPFRSELRLENVSFRYDPKSPTEAVHELNLVIPARQVVALCGPSGAGKSTLADLVLGLLTPTAGRILIDGEPLSGDRIHHWRRTIGYVPQETFLFHDTVRANLVWARPEADEAEIRLALRAAAAEEFVNRLPLGLETVVGDRGVRFSGGERQRIALARAILRRPALLVLDEATSALDTENERLIQAAIESLHGKLAILLIAHRLTTVRMADQIVVIKEGRFVEQGTWEDLAGRERGAFRQLLAAGGHP